MRIDFLLKVFAANEDKDAIVWNGNTYNYKWLLGRIDFWKRFIESKNVKRGSVAILEADFSPNSASLFLALTEHECILVPLTDSVEREKPEFIKTSQGEISFKIDSNDSVEFIELPNSAKHPIYERLRRIKHAGLVCFTSGSTGKSKAVAHDLVNILEKYKTRRRGYRTITFLLYDHLGGVNTMLHTLANAGCIVTVRDHSPDSVLGLVEKYRVELLPTSPTFINLILLANAYKRHDISSLKIVTYGTEPMLESTLKRFHELFPEIQLLQTYGLTEVGVLRSKSKSSDSLWVRVGGEGFETRVVDGVLQIKAKSLMLGYLNAPDPFTKDGWLNTEDRVAVDGNYMKFLGRRSEIINVGGKKVFPSEVESVIKEVDNVAEVTVYGEKNPIIGNIVCAKVRPQKKEDPTKLSLRIKKHCKDRLERFKIPVRITTHDKEQYSKRFKKIRT